MPHLPVEVKKCEQRGERTLKTNSKMETTLSCYMDLEAEVGVMAIMEVAGTKEASTRAEAPAVITEVMMGTVVATGMANSSGGYGGQGNSSNSYAQYQGYQGGQGGRDGQPQNQMMGYNQGQSGDGGGPSQSGQYPGQISSNMAQTANSTVPFNAAGGPQSSPSTNAASAQYAQYAMWYSMQQQAAAAVNSSNPARCSRCFGEWGKFG